eukprot:762556-Hanusia_phi.AAC.6
MKKKTEEGVARQSLGGVFAGSRGGWGYLVEYTGPDWIRKFSWFIEGRGEVAFEDLGWGTLLRVGRIVGPTKGFLAPLLVVPGNHNIECVSTGGVVDESQGLGWGVRMRRKGFNHWGWLIKLRQRVGPEDSGATVGVGRPTPVEALWAIKTRTDGVDENNWRWG